MKNIRWIIALVLFIGCGTAFGQTQSSIMADKFGEIRAKMVRDACSIVGYNNTEVMNLIDNSSIMKFDTQLSNAANAEIKNKEWYLHLIIGEANANVGALKGSQLLDYQTKINKFRSQLKLAYTHGNRLDSIYKDNPSIISDKNREIGKKDGEYMDAIQALVEECQFYIDCEADGNTEEYLRRYKDGAFKALIEGKSGTPTPTPSPKPKQEPQPKPVEKSEEQIAFDGCDNWASIESFLSNYKNSTYDIDKKGWDICKSTNYSISDLRKYLNIFGEGANQKIEAENRIKEYDLKNCKNLDGFESVLEQWGNDPEFRDKVYEKCWKYCEERGELEAYQRYVSFVDRFEGSLHYKEAKDRIDALKSQTGIIDDEDDDVVVDDDSLLNRLWYLLAGIAVIALLLVIILRKRKKNQSQVVSVDTELREENAAYERCSTISACDYYLNTYPSGRFVKEVIVKKEGLLDKIKKEEDDAFKACTTVTACDYYLIKYPKGRYVNEVKERKIKLAESNNPKPKPEPENKTKPEPKQKQGEWVVVGASVKGNGHIESNMPCQDNSKFEILGKGWGVAVVSDGAGSAAHSDMGSKVVVERGTLHFKNLVEKEGWMDKNTLPSDAEWLQKSYFVLKTIRNEVEMVAKKNNVDLKSLSATCLAVVFSPLGLLAVHVGDGRMGCKTAAGGWKAIMTPHKGDEANQTLFLISEFWDIPNYVQSGVLVPESIVVREPVDAFAVMSDGCESTAWLCTAQNAETGKYYDQNKPFEGFFNPLEETLASFHKDNVPEEERKEKWYKFIESGTKGFVKEQDDKTMILGAFL